jgi:diguanylate cyclase (GGDEF)-like protein
MSAMFLKHGADDFLCKPFQKEEFYCRVYRTVETLDNIQAIKRSAYTDQLTGLPNRLHFFRTVPTLFQAFQEEDTAFVVAMIDIDHFKTINDTYGHAGGDVALRHLSGIMQETLAGMDMVARFGGEEFVVTMPETSIEGATELAERICSNVRKQPYRTDGDEMPITVSIGVTAFLQTDRDYAQILDRADYALYQAKTLGRDRCEVVQEDRDSPIDSDGHKS